jgi:hypothetical protein
MRFSVILPFAFIASAFALPTVYTGSAVAVRQEIPLIKEIDTVLDNLGLTLDNTITELLDCLGLGKVDSDLNDLLKELVGAVDKTVNGVDDVADGLLKDLGLGSVVKLDRTCRITAAAADDDCINY